MAAMTNKSVTQTSLSSLRRSFSQIKMLSTSSSPSSSASVPSDVAEAAKVKKSTKKKNLFEVAQFLPNWGIGYKMAKSHWRDVAYEITKINLYKDGRHGKAWGVRYKAGVKVAEAPVKMSGVHKRGWKYFPQSGEYSEESKKEEEPSLA